MRLRSGAILRQGVDLGGSEGWDVRWLPLDDEVALGAEVCDDLYIAPQLWMIRDTSGDSSSSNVGA